jgi:hypothetical protein
MALKSTICKAELSIADIDRGYYRDHALTIARHPSETDERMMVRVLAFALNADDALQFGRGLSAENEPDLWRRDLTGAIEQRIEVGLPDERERRKACGRARCSSVSVALPTRRRSVRSGTRRDQPDAWKVGCESPCVARQQGIHADSRMGTNEEFRKYVALPPSLPAVAHERLSGQKQCRARQLDHRQVEVIDGPVQRLDSGKSQRQFRIDDRIDSQSMNLGLGP